MTTAQTLVAPWSEADGRRALADRSDGRCEGCGRHGDLEFAHRVRRSRGGGWEPWNALHLCHRCHHGTGHGGAYIAQGLGWEVLPSDDPALKPAWILTPHRYGPAWHLLCELDDTDGIRRHVVRPVEPVWTP